MATPSNGLPSFPASDDEAKARYEATKSADPFPEISPALLNTADLLDYIAATGMIHPLDIDPTHMDKTFKPASCAIPVGGEWLYWPPTTESDDPDGNTGCLEPGGELWLKPNSIVYVTLAPYFRIPDYIAARYNLRIKHIYRGILVGTGPLVDPGFEGRLSVPLHNLTANPYLIKGGEPLVWMEFTKLSENQAWLKTPDSGQERLGKYISFPHYKVERQTVRDYVRHAHEGAIRSSIPEQTEGAREAAETAEAQVKKFRNVSLLALAGLIIAMIALTYQALDFVNGAKGDEAELRREVQALRGDVVSQRQGLHLCVNDTTVSTRCLRNALAEP